MTAITEKRVMDIRALNSHGYPTRASPPALELGCA